MNHNFLVPVVDTDSITISKQDGSPFSEEEISKLTDEINSLTEEMISWELEFYIDKVIAFKAKNYVLYDSKAKEGKQLKIKGSALKSSKIEPALREFHKEVIDSIISDRTDFGEIYNKYVNEIKDVKDMSRWASKKTITKKIFESPRENEAKVLRAIQGTEYVEGDKVLMFTTTDNELCLIENFNGDYSKEKLFKRLYDCSKIFDSVLDTKSLFLNYSLKRNQKLLSEFKQL